MPAGFVFDTDAFNFACAIGLLNALAPAVASKSVEFHFVRTVERELKGEIRNLVENLKAAGVAASHRITPSEPDGRLFEKLFSNRRKQKGGAVHEGECMTVAWAKANGRHEPLVMVDRGGRVFAEAHGLRVLGIADFAFECIRAGILSVSAAKVCLEKWQESQGRPSAFDFDAAYAAHVAGEA